MRSVKWTLVRVLSALVFAAVVLPTVSAAAVESSSLPTTDAATPGAIDVQLWMAAQPGQAVAIVSVTLDPSVTLPAVVQIPVVGGMVVDWAGEIADSGDVNQDIERDYVLKDGVGGQYVEMRLTSFRVGQVDLSGKPMTVSGTATSAVFEYVQSAPATQTGFAVRVPPGVTRVEIDPPSVGSPQKSEAGESLYSLPDQVMKTGDAQTVSVSYSTGGDAGVAAPTGPIDTLLRILVAALVLALGALLWLSFTQRSASRESRGADEPGHDSGEQGRRSHDPSSDIDERDDPFLLDD